jgi:hypothetical protein
MSLRSLGPWLLGGALLASAYANFSMYRGLKPAAGESVPSAILDPGAISSFHLAPGAGDEECPTLDLLELTAEQRDRIQKCSLSSLDLRTDLAIEIQTASSELEELLSKDILQGTRILELADRISSLRSKQYKAWIGSILVVRDVLTPEQLTLLHQLESN